MHRMNLQDSAEPSGLEMRKYCVPSGWSWVARQKIRTTTWQICGRISMVNVEPHPFISERLEFVSTCPPWKAISGQMVCRDGRVPAKIANRWVEMCKLRLGRQLKGCQNGLGWDGLPWLIRIGHRAHHHTCQHIQAAWRSRDWPFNLFQNLTGLDGLTPKRFRFRKVEMLQQKVGSSILE